MKKEIKKQWIEALRSGKYEQGRGRLYKNGKYCCLGVLREIAPDEMRKSPGMIRGELSKKVMDWAGLPSSNPIIGKNNCDTATKINDQLRKDFNEIADMIEKNVPED